MPFTFSHPAAVLPLRRFVFLQTVPLIIGSMTPDVPYFFPVRYGRLIGDTHTFHGSFAVCVPLGMALLVLALLLREPLTVLLGPRLRWLCLRSFQRFTQQRWNWVLAVPSVLIGAWTHIVWDSFTHGGGWTVQRMAALSAPITVFGWDMVVYHLLQYLSSVFGLLVLAFWLRHMLKRVPEPAQPAPISPRTRWIVLLSICAAAFVIGGFHALKVWHPPSYYRLSYLLLTRVIAWFAVLYLGTGLAVMFGKLRSGNPPHPAPSRSPPL
jgi:hypothetical protein